MYCFDVFLAQYGRVLLHVFVEICYGTVTYRSHQERYPSKDITFLTIYGVVLHPTKNKISCYTH